MAEDVGVAEGRNKTAPETCRYKISTFHNTINCETEFSGRVIVLLVRAEMGRQQLVYYYVPGIQLSTSSELGSSGRRKDNVRCLNDGPSPCICGGTWLYRVGGFRGPSDWLDGCLVVCSSERYNEVDPNWALVRELFAVISFRLSKNDDFRTNIILEWNGGHFDYWNGW